MAILGNLVKNAINVASSVTLDSKSPQEMQQEALRELLTRAEHTSFGTYYGFSKILSQDDIQTAFAEQVPLFDYPSINNRWWKQQQKQTDITWPGKPDYFALSSGTTGKKSKRIPVSDDMIEDSRMVGVKLIKDLSNFDLPTHVFESEVLMLGSSASLQKNKHGFLEGEISGINTSNFPEWYDWFYRPGKEIATISDWDKRLEKIVEDAPNWDIGSIAGIPSWVQIMLKAIIAKYELNTIHDIWPNLEVYNSGGVAFAPFKKGFEQLTSRPLTIIDTYLASEGFFGYTDRPSTDAMKLVVDSSNYYEFVPFDSRGFDEEGKIKDNPEVYSLKEVKNDEEYALIISTCSGTWRYAIGDTIKFTDIENLQFKITGRTKFFLNVVGSQLSEEKLNTAIAHLSDQINAAVDEFSVACMQTEDGEYYYHQWLISLEASKAAKEKELADILDEHLKHANKNYRVARSKALDHIQVKAITPDKWYNMLGELKKKGGQVKTPKVVKAKKMQTFLDFCS